ncbi:MULTISPECIES: WXG100 family type VII secretion target [unclassified Leucobacter]|uniref:WXG100 family type VII secretion target n=1 Tax=unclassified Leucobacter TaxID=2621730 RepID=UPI00165D9BFF|nr:MULTISPECIES: WXG100 family type VII secretion target [unclassified Leucobacter]MBC9926606.1 WXG100 family type VII secretion target [Leucobacter sp. cx-169]
MANISVSYGEIEQAASQLGAGRDEIAQRLRGMQARISGLVSSGFVTDQASAKFDGAYGEYTTSANTVIDKLTEIQAFLTQTANALRELDAQIAAKIN